ncbi:hypothetical protein DI392_01285 [Vibrio albus]|uniref:MipA/OmpV family protein n=1 Tax=Vibrio albus TaxID=2200953 RepID=A0A2U3BDT7_9VIBR|nr:MipA/OmpV family protein [Vibrio albus]PWI34940.1 hypothetical protein DI392_01285 [Vibrio albus]
MGNKGKIVKRLVTGLVLFSCIPAYAEQASEQTSEWSLGIGGAYIPSIFKDTSSTTMMFPIGGYEGEHFYWQGLEVGYALNSKQASHNLIFHLGYDTKSFDPDDSDNLDVKKLDEREGTVLGGMSYQYQSVLGTLKLTGAADIAGEHNGWLGGLTWSYPFNVDRWGITPSIGYTYYSEDYNQHMYGVSAAESTKTAGAISQFTPDGEGEYFASLSAFYGLTEDLVVNVTMTYINLQGSVEESPILEKTAFTTGVISLIYMF